ncbi:MAG: cohesin domain-containing protein [Bacteroidales bacterium]|nr:cohesin domain-containing protein [Bacteroidales bacterium]
MKTLILKILPLLFLIVWPGILMSQTITTTAGSVTSCPGQIVVPVNVTDCNGIGAISLILNFDDTKLIYNGYQNLNSALTVGLLIINSVANKVVISWANTTAANLGNSTMVELKFNAAPSTTSLAWDLTPGNCEYSDVLGNVLLATFTNGTATINSPPEINIQPVDKTALVGQNTSFTVSATGTGLAYLWQISTNGGANWSDLTNGAPYSGVTSPTLTITNVLFAYNGYQYRCRLTGTCTPVIYTNEVTLSVIDPITTTLPTASFCPGNIIVPVTVTNFTGVATFSLTFSYNTSCLNYNGFQNLNGTLSGGTFVANAADGKVYMTWSSTTPVTFGDGTLVELQFAATTGTSSLVWDVATAGNCEYSALSGSSITAVFVNGNETIYGLPAVTAHPLNKIIAKGQNTTFSISATGSGLTYLWQVSTNGGANFNDLANGGYYSGVTSTTLTITSAQLVLSGNQYRCRVIGTCSPVAFSNPGVLIVLPNVITTCGTVTGCPGQSIIPVNVTDFIGVASFSMTLNYNPSVLTYAGYQLFNAALSGGSFAINASGGKIYLTWSSTTAVTLTTGALLIELKFDGVSGSSPLTWDTPTPGNCEYSDLNGQVIFSTWNNGNVTINVSPVIITHPANKTIYASGSTSFSVTATGTGLGYLWQVSTDGGTNWMNLTNSSPYSGVTTSTLTINPASTGMNGYQYRCKVSGNCSLYISTNLLLQDDTVANGQTYCYNATQAITVAGNGTKFIVQNGGSASMVAGQKISYLPGTIVNSGGYMHGSITTTGQYCIAQPLISNSAQLVVTQVPVTTSSGTITNSCTGNLIIPVSVSNCLNVGSISLTMIFDTTKMTFEGYQGVNTELSGGFLVVNRASNRVILSWASTTAANVGSGVLIQYRFKANSGISSTISWDTQTAGACEYADINGTVITSFYNTSNITILTNALIVNAGSDLIKTGSPVQLNGSATGATTPYTWLWSPAGSLNNPAIPNPMASPVVTTAYTLTVTANNGCVGTDVMNVMVDEVPTNLVLQDITIPNGVSNCYNALQTINVAGGGTIFIVENGGSAVMIAGLKINYLPGTKVYPGGYLHGYITTTGDYCNTLLAPEILTIEENSHAPTDGTIFRIYPNPTTGQFNIVLKENDLPGNVYVTVYGSRGEIILSDVMMRDLHKGFSLSGQPSGLYFVRVVSGNKGFTGKLIKQ